MEHRKGAILGAAPSRQYDPFSGTSQSTTPSTSQQQLKPVDWSKAGVPQWTPFNTKNVMNHSSAHAAVPACDVPPPLNDKQADEWRKENSVIVMGQEKLPPMLHFNALQSLVPPRVFQNIINLKFPAPTVIQSQTWPYVFSGRDFVGIAQTGSGKTLAFGIPAIVAISAQKQIASGQGPLVLILAPTRELAQQIEAELAKVLPPNIRAACVFGGSFTKRDQIYALRRDPQIVVATPGRLIDFLSVGLIKLSQVMYVVLDEADRMLDMGFEPQVRNIFSQLRPEKQTLMFSATWPKEIQSLAATFMTNVIRIQIGSVDLLANANVTQSFIQTGQEQKFHELLNILQKHSGTRVLVFCKTKRNADYIATQLQRCQWNAHAIHGDKEQQQREFILKRFRSDAKMVLVATDIAARGLDVKELEAVVNFDFPMQIDDYVHRIGRTGRAGMKGCSYTFLSLAEQHFSPSTARDLIKIAEKSKQEIPQFLRDYANRAPQFSVQKRSWNGAPVTRYRHSNRPTFDGHSGQFVSPVATPSLSAPPLFGNGQHIRFREGEDEGGSSSKRQRLES